MPQQGPTREGRSHRFIEIELTRRGIVCVALLLDEQAPRTCDAVWRALPQEGDVFHAKYASNEIYTLVPDFAGGLAVPENRTVTPAEGDVLYFLVPACSRIPRGAPSPAASALGLVDLALFYDRNNLLLSPSEGFTPGTVVARIVENLDAIREAGHRLWREGTLGERLAFRRLGCRESRRDRKHGRIAGRPTGGKRS